MFDWLFDYHLLAAFFTLTALEIILGIDNIVFIALLVQHLPEPHRSRARTVGLSLALVMRVLLLLGIAWVMGLTTPLFSVAGHELSGKDILMLVGGGFLLYKGTDSIHETLTGEKKSEIAKSMSAGFAGTVVQILFIDLVFSFDSVITAVGMTNHIPIIIAAMVVAMIVMLAAAGFIATFIEKHPTLKMLALAFIMMIGVFLVAEGLGFHVPKGYIYFGMAFSLGVELLNLSAAARRKKNKQQDLKIPEPKN